MNEKISTNKTGTKQNSSESTADSIGLGPMRCGYKFPAAPRRLCATPYNGDVFPISIKGRNERTSHKRSSSHFIRSE